MKQNLILIGILLLIWVKTIAQIGIGTTTPNPVAILDVVSTNKGFLPPRVTNVAAIITPVAGLLIYDNSKQCMRYYNGTIWSDCMGGIVPVFTCGNTMTDIDGNSYPTVLIGGQCWMAADLKVSRYPNGDPIPYVDNNAAWAALADTNTADAYSFYGDSNSDGLANITYLDYGALYTYAAAIGDNWARDNNVNQGLCPDGWHLPSDTEWTTLSAFLGGTSIAGGRMKETSTAHWNTPNTGATNSSGFTAIPGGSHNNAFGIYNDVGYRGNWWTSTGGTSNASSRYLDWNKIILGSFSYNKSAGRCIRCIKD